MKLTWFLKLVSLLALLVTPLTAGALQTDQTTLRHYQLQISLFDGDRLVGQPRIKVADASPATFSVEREGGYSIRLVAARVEEQSEISKVRLAAEVFFREGIGWRQVAAPRLILALGTTATLETQPRGTSRGFRMEILATEASPSEVSAKHRPCTQALETRGAATSRSRWDAASGDGNHISAAMRSRR